MPFIIRTAAFRTATLFLAISASAALAQSVNIDFGDAKNLPPDDYAAAGLPGVWNSNTGGTGQVMGLVGLDGAPILAGLSLLPAPETIVVNDPDTTGNEEILMDDCLPGLGDVVLTASFGGLENGIYNVITYAWVPAAPSEGSLIWINDGGVGQTVGGEWPGQLQQGVTHALHNTAVVDGSLVISLVGSVFGNSGVFNGIQLVKLDHLPADFNGDNFINVDDLLILLDHWTTDGHGCDGIDPCQADINNDLIVNVDDLLLLLQAWSF